MGRGGRKEGYFEFLEKLDRAAGEGDAKSGATATAAGAGIGEG